MRLSALRLINFRCFEDFELVLDPGLTVLVAANGNGKTSILQAISYLLAVFVGRFKGLATSTIGESDYREIWTADPKVPGQYEVSRPGAYMGIEGLFETDADYSKLGFELPKFPCDLVRVRDKTSATAKRQKAANYGLRLMRQFADVFVQADAEKASLEFPIFTYYGTERAVPILKSPGRKKKKSAESRAGAYSRALGGSLIFQSAVEWLAKQEELQKDEIIARQDFTHRTLAFETIQLAFEKMMPGFSNLRVCRSPLHVLVDMREGDVFRTVNVDRQLSDGFKIVLVMLVDIVTRLLKANGGIEGMTPRRILDGRGIVLIDEIDLHLHPSWQQRILMDLRKTFPNIQFIVTTHSPQIVQSVPSSSIRVIDRRHRVQLVAKSEGLETSQVLDDVFGTKPYPEGNELRQRMMRYVDAVYEGRWDAPEVRRLGEELRRHFEGADPKFDAARLHAEEEEWERRHA